MVVPEALRNVLQPFERSPRSLRPIIVWGALAELEKAWTPANDTERATWRHECLAWGVMPNHPSGESPSKIYFGPPANGRVAPDALTHWTNRAIEVSHPSMRARYADVSFDFAALVEGIKPDQAHARLAAAAYIDAAALDGESYESWVSVERALQLSLALRDRELIRRSKDAIFAFHRAHGILDQPGPAFTAWRLLKGNKKVGLDESEEQRLIDDLETLLKGWASPGTSFHHGRAADAAERLAKHYNAVGQKGDVLRVVERAREALEQAAESGSGLQKMAWYESFRKSFGFLQLKELEARLIRCTREAGSQARQEAKQLVVEVPVDVSQVARDIAEIVDGDLETCVRRIAGRFTPDPAEARERMKLAAAAGPMHALLPITKLTDALPTTVIDGVDSDPEGRLMDHFATEAPLDSIVLLPAMQELIKKVPPTDRRWVDLLSKATLIRADRYTLIIEGLSRFATSDFAAAIHLIIPQVENAFRELVLKLGGRAGKPNRNEGLDEILLDGVLREPCLTEFFITAMKHDVALFLRAVLTDRRGVNLRNLVCHGLVASDWFDGAKAARVLQVLFLAITTSIDPAASLPAEI